MLLSDHSRANYLTFQLDSNQLNFKQPAEL